MQQDKEFLGTAPVGRLLFRLALPTVVAQLVNMLYNIVDRIYIGHIEGYGDLALTGVGVCMPLIMIVSAFAALVGSGGAPRASISMGKKDYESAERILGGCFGLQLIISVLLTVALLIWNKPLLLTFGASENTIQYATEYMSIYALGTIFVQLTLGLNAFISAQGFSKFSMLSVVIGAACNIVLDPIFIYGFDMGVKERPLPPSSHRLPQRSGSSCSFAAKKPSCTCARNTCCPCRAWCFPALPSALPPLSCRQARA